ncbi:MAG: hypothetical protein HY077_10710 [Elusimicrobia bacterium]|nr:hypothetical protein [Elusimicrobiota bacterium]
MRTMSIAALAAIGLMTAAVSFAETAPSLEQAVSGLSQSVKPQAAALKANAAKAAAAAAVEQGRTYRLDFERGRWRLRPDTNPPGSGLRIDAKVGERVRLELYNNSWGRHEDAQFIVRSLGIEVWLRSRGERATVAFVQTKEGIHLINDDSRVGMIIVRK